jgi:hypothetical protein
MAESEWLSFELGALNNAGGTKYKALSTKFKAPTTDSW